MKILIFLLSSAVLFSCSTNIPAPTTSERLQEYVKSQMKDPTSFQLIKSQVVDTIMMSKFLIDKYNEDTSMITKMENENRLDILTKADIRDIDNYKKLLDKKTEVYRESASKDSVELTQLKPDRIFFISYIVDYRAKNSFGALDKGTALVSYYPADTTFKMTNQ